MNNVSPYVGNPGQVLNDINNCGLQNVSWVIPDGNWSDHAGANAASAGGPSWVAAIVNAVGSNTACDTTNGKPGYWYDTVILVVWDDWGGFYDDVPPPDCSGPPPCAGYSNSTGGQYVYGFRVPLLVVSAYTKYASCPAGQPCVGYISGTAAQGEVPPYIHDFGSILNFTEYVFGRGGMSLGEISPQYHYADFLALDGPNFTNICSPTVCPYGLSDFFNFGQTPRTFVSITGAKYPPGCFTNPSSSTCFFTNYPQDPDDDEIEEQ